MIGSASAVASKPTVHPPRDLVVPSTPLLLPGAARSGYEIALDEMAVVEEGANYEIRPIDRKRSPEEVRRFVRGLDKARRPALVLYEKGRPKTRGSRRIATREVVVTITQGQNAALLAEKLGAELVGELSYAPGSYRFRAADSAEALLIPEALKAVEGVVSVVPQLARYRERYAVPNDPLYALQWHLSNHGQGGGTAGVDLNVEGAWNTVRGTGVNIGIVDDGVQASHPDLSPNIVSAYDYDFRDGDSDPSPNRVTINAQDPLNDPREDDHGTMVAGVAAGRGFNGIGTAGVAPQAGIVPIRLIGDYLTDLQEADAIAHRNDVIAIKNNSWGPLDNGAIVAGPDTLAQSALRSAAMTGRGGLGNVLVWSAGNGGREDDNSNKNGYANSIYTIAVGATDDRGVRASYSEEGSNILVCAPVGDGAQPGTATSDLLDNDGANFDGWSSRLADPDYTDEFLGTSSSAPMVSGVAALMLQAKPGLGWRDVLEILVRTAVKVDAANPSWATNGAGFHFSNEYGAGLVDASAAVSMATSWTNLAMMRSASRQSSLSLPAPIPDGTGAAIEAAFNFVGTKLRVEQVEFHTFMDHAMRGDLKITLTSPSGMVSRMAWTGDDDAPGYFDWPFSSVQHWGESADGVWTVRIEDPNPGNAGDLWQATLTLHGTETGAATIPATPQGLTATAQSVQDILVQWQDVASNETAYVVEYSYGWGGAWTVAETLPANATSYVQPYVPTGVPFYYRVKAMNGGASSGYSNTVVTQTLDGDGALIYRTGFNTSEGYVANTALGGQATWTAYTPSFNYPGHGVLADQFSALGMSGRGQQAYVGKSSSAPSALRSVTLPLFYETQPGNVVEFSSLVSVIDSNNGKYDGFGFDIYNWDGQWLFEVLLDNSGRKVLTASAANPTYLDSGVSFTNGTIYTLTMSIDLALNRITVKLGNKTVVSSKVMANTGTNVNLGYLDVTWYAYNPAAPGNNFMLIDDLELDQRATVPPAIPTGLTAIGSSASIIHIFWDEEPLATGYEVQRSLTGSGGWSSIGTATEDLPIYIDPKLPAGATRYYRVRSTSPNGNSSYTSPVYATTLTEYQEWKDNNRLAVDTDDQYDGDGDRVPLLVEYGLATSPRRDSSAALPETEITDTHILLTYFRGRSDVDYRVLVSSALGGWSETGVIQEFEISGLWVTAAYPLAGHPAGFLKLEVSR